MAWFSLASQDSLGVFQRHALDRVDKDARGFGNCSLRRAIHRDHELLSQIISPDRSQGFLDLVETCRQWDPDLCIIEKTAVSSQVLDGPLNPHAQSLLQTLHDLPRSQARLRAGRRLLGRSHGLLDRFPPLLRSHARNVRSSQSARDECCSRGGSNRHGLPPSRMKRPGTRDARPHVSETQPTRPPSETRCRVSLGGPSHNERGPTELRRPSDSQRTGLSSTLRFWARPATVSFEAAGLDEP